MGHKVLEKVLTSDANGLATWQPVPGDNWGSQVVQTNSTLSGNGTVSSPLGINLSNANTWTGAQTFNGGANFPGSGIWNSSGNVGIGTTEPQTKLQVKYGNLESSSLYELILHANYGTNPETTPNAGGRIGITFSGYPNGVLNSREKIAGIYMVSEDGECGYTRQTGLAFYTAPFDQSALERVRIDHLGNVGIGTTAPEAKLCKWWCY